MQTPIDDLYILLERRAKDRASFPAPGQTRNFPDHHQLVADVTSTGRVKRRVSDGIAAGMA
jgi:hypothetical protein